MDIVHARALKPLCETDRHAPPVRLFLVRLHVSFSLITANHSQVILIEDRVRLETAKLIIQSFVQTDSP